MSFIVISGRLPIPKSIALLMYFLMDHQTTCAFVVGCEYSVVGKTYYAIIAIQYYAIFFCKVQSLNGWVGAVIVEQRMMNSNADFSHTTWRINSSFAASWSIFDEMVFGVYRRKKKRNISYEIWNIDFILQEDDFSSCENSLHCLGIMFFSFSAVVFFALLYTKTPQTKIKNYKTFSKWRMCYFSKTKDIFL